MVVLGEVVPDYDIFTCSFMSHHRTFTFHHPKPRSEPISYVKAYFP